MLIRFWKSFKFYIKHTGLKNTIFVTIPNLINSSRYSKIDGVYKINSSFEERFEDLIEEMEEDIKEINKELLNEKEQDAEKN